MPCRLLLPLLTLCAVVHGQSTHLVATFTPSNFTFDPVTPDLKGVPWDETRNVTAVFQANKPCTIRVHLSCVDTEICTFNEKAFTTLNFTRSNSLTVTQHMTMEAMFIGRSRLFVHAVEGETEVPVDFDAMPVTVLRSEETQRLNNIFIGIMVVLVTFNVFMMGTQLQIHLIMHVLRKPIGPAIGFGCQYIIMPLMAYGLARIFLEGYPMLQFGYFAYGCSPGGGNSNFWTILLDGNLDLSITMTFMSNVAALVMMPLWLFTLGQTFYDEGVAIPFLNIVGTLFSMLIPALLGMYLGVKRPKWIPVLRKIIKWFTLCMLVFIVGFSFYINWYIFLLMRWYTLVPGALLTFGGYSIAYTVALLCRQRHREARTISIETGIQNAGIAIIICQLSFDAPDSDMTIVRHIVHIPYCPQVMPICCMIFVGMPLWCWLGIRTLRRRCCGWVDQDVLDDELAAEERAKSKEKEMDSKLQSIDLEPSTKSTGTQVVIVPESSL